MQRREQAVGGGTMRVNPAPVRVPRYRVCLVWPVADLHAVEEELPSRSGLASIDTVASQQTKLSDFICELSGHAWEKTRESRRSSKTNSSYRLREGQDITINVTTQ